jgi:hypothetical protein
MSGLRHAKARKDAPMFSCAEEMQKRFCPSDFAIRISRPTLFLFAFD